MVVADATGDEVDPLPISEGGPGGCVDDLVVDLAPQLSGKLRVAGLGEVGEGCAVAELGAIECNKQVVASFGIGKHGIRWRWLVHRRGRR